MVRLADYIYANINATYRYWVIEVYEPNSFEYLPIAEKTYREYTKTREAFKQLSDRIKQPW